MSNMKRLQLNKLDKHLSEVSVPNPPNGGWLRAIRSGLGMSMQQAASRIGVSKQSIARLEYNEIHDAITLKSLRKAAEALDCHVVYALVPNADGLQGIVRQQALRKATDMVISVDHTMRLEAQGVDNMEDKINEIADDLAKNPNSRLWE